METLRVAAGEQELHVVRMGDGSRPAVLFLHGYPDSHRVWLEVMEELCSDWSVVAFDLRGVGGSGPPAPAPTYRIDRLLPDIAAVLDAVVGPGGRAHLVAHDWGSTIGWSFVTHPEHGKRVLSFTSMSGPHLGLWQRFLWRGLTSLRPRLVLQVLWQLFKSTYVLFLVARPVPELFWRLGGVPAWRTILRMAGVPKGDAMLDESRAKVLSMTLRPMALYRRNVLRPPPSPAEGGVAAPCLLVIPSKDPFVSEAIYHDLGDYVPDLRVERLPASHWAQRSHHAEFVALVRDFVGQVEAR